MLRRDFIQKCLLAGLSFPVVNDVLADTAGQNFPLNQPNKTLILVEFKGGNDSLNMVIPFRDKHYFTLRPNIAIKEGERFTISDNLAFHIGLSSLASLWLNEQIAVVQGVGYQQPNRSHFRSIEIWDTGSESNIIKETGWLNALTNLKGKQSVAGMVLSGERGPLNISGNIVELNNVAKFIKQTQKTAAANGRSASNNAALAYLLSVQSETLSASRQFQKEFAPKEDATNYGKDRFAKQMKLCQEVLESGLGIPVIKVSLGSFDTHVNQKLIQSRLFTQFSNAVSTFAKNTQKSNWWNNTLIMTYSEFGRRVKENGAKGTDHGTAATHLVMGGKVKGGLYGEMPDLARLDKNDMVHTTDFKQMYATLAESWWQHPKNEFSAAGYQSLNFLKT